MTQRSVTRIAGAIFLLIALLHGLRLAFGWEAVIGGWTVPMWLSWVAIAVLGALAYAAMSAK